MPIYRMELKCSFIFLSFFNCHCLLNEWLFNPHQFLLPSTTADEITLCEINLKWVASATPNELSAIIQNPVAGIKHEHIRMNSFIVLFKKKKTYLILLIFFLQMFKSPLHCRYEHSKASIHFVWIWIH